MRILIVCGLLFAAHLNLTALVPAAADQAPPPWWVGGRLVWPFGLDTHTLLPAGGAVGALTPILGIASAAFFLLAAAAVLHWLVPAPWFGVSSWPAPSARSCCRSSGSLPGPSSRCSWTACCSGHCSACT